jgi:hypothetical protein
LTSSVLAVPPGLVGAQRPRVSYFPPSVSTESGREAVELAAVFGLVLDEWEAWALEMMCAERADGRWAAWEVGLVVARQNGKGAILEARELAGLFLFGEKTITHSAHEFKTSLDHQGRLETLIAGSPEFSRRVASVRHANGQESINLKSGASIRFFTRTKSGGRGLGGELGGVRRGDDPAADGDRRVDADVEREVVAREPAADLHGVAGRPDDP